MQKKNAKKKKNGKKFNPEFKPKSPQNEPEISLNSPHKTLNNLLNPQSSNIRTRTRLLTTRFIVHINPGGLNAQPRTPLKIDRYFSLFFNTVFSFLLTINIVYQQVS